MNTLTSSTSLDTVERAVAELAIGRPVVVVDDEDRENEGDLTFAASLATPELMALLVRHTSGYVCAPAAAEVLDLGVDGASPATVVRVAGVDGSEIGWQPASRRRGRTTRRGRR